FRTGRYHCLHDTADIVDMHKVRRLRTDLTGFSGKILGHDTIKTERPAQPEHIQIRIYSPECLLPRQQRGVQPVGSTGPLRENGLDIGRYTNGTKKKGLLYGDTTEEAGQPAETLLHSLLGIFPGNGYTDNGGIEHGTAQLPNGIPAVEIS